MTSERWHWRKYYADSITRTIRHPPVGVMKMNTDINLTHSRQKMLHWLKVTERVDRVKLKLELTETF